MDALMPVLVLPDIEPALDCYLKQLEVEQRWAGTDERTGKIAMVGMKFGDATFMLHARPDGAGIPPGDAVELWFWSSDPAYDLDAYYKRLTAHDAVAILEQIDDRHWGDRTFKLRDPFGFIWHVGRAIGGEQGVPEAQNLEAATPWRPASAARRVCPEPTGSGIPMSLT